MGITQKTGLKGQVKPPGDKSLSHRALMLASLPFYQPRVSPVCVTGWLQGEDVRSTMKVLKACGLQVEEQSNNELLILPLSRYQEPVGILDCGNSGTSIRLLTGLLAGQGFLSVLTGDDSLRRRPMGRVLKPLQEMGANIQARSGGQYAPLVVCPTEKKLQGRSLTLQTASAQVKSAILLAGLFAEGPTVLVEPVQSRDHTEQCFKGLGIDLSEAVNADGHRVWTLNPPQGQTLTLPERWQVPADFSSAAFLLVGAACMPGSELLLTGVNLNPTRTGLLQVLQTVGLNFTVENQHEAQGELCGDMQVCYGELKGDLTVSGPMVPRLIDELPILAVAGLFLNGTLTVQDAEELRIKESDRIQAMANCFEVLGIPFESREDGFVLHGNPDGRSLAKRLGHKTYVLPGSGDHRIVMSMLILNRILQQWDSDVPDWDVQGREWVNISFPGFERTLEMLLQ